VLTRFKVIQDRLRGSLFFVPMLFVVGGAVLAEVLLAVDERVDDMPSRLTATVDSARGVLSIVASATLAFAGISFSVSLLLISLASSQYSPRVVHGLFRDPFNRRVIGTVIGTFTYCLVTLRAVRGPVDAAAGAVVPSVSVLVAVVLGIVSILAIVAFISHSAHTMDVSKILHGVTDESIELIRATWPDPSTVDPATDPNDATPTEPSGGGLAIMFDRHGWVQRIDHDAIFEVIEPGSHVRLDTSPGRYAIPETPLCTIWPTPIDGETTAERLRAGVVLGETRTMQQDVSYGVRQLADVALKALSPGINDPTTAQDALFHLGAVVRELLVRQPPRHSVGADDRTIVPSHEVTHDELVGLAFDEVRIASAGQPTVQISLLEILHLLSASVADRSAAHAALARQATLVVEVDGLATLPAADHERVRCAYAERFAS